MGTTGSTGPTGAAGGQIYSSNIAIPYEYSGTSYGLPSGASSATSFTPAVVLAVPASCTASGFSVTNFYNGGYSGGTAGSATITLVQGTAATVQSASPVATALSCSMTATGTTAGNVSCSSASTTGLTAGNFISIRVTFGSAAGPFEDSNFLVRFVCQ